MGKSGGSGKAAAKAAKKEKQASKAAKKEAAAIKATTVKGKGKSKDADDEEDLDAILERYKQEMEAVGGNWNMKVVLELTLGRSMRLILS